MPPAKKRKIVDESKVQDDAPLGDTKILESQASQHIDEKEVEPLEDSQASSNAVDKDKERRERFKALQARAVSLLRLMIAKCRVLTLRKQKSAHKNYKEAAAEAQRLATDPNVLASLSRKHAFASHNLLKADTEAAGEDFERKRAWDWTVDESEKWDKRMQKKEKHREDVAFQDYTQDARKIYKKQLRELKPDIEGYEKEKAAAVQKAALNGGLEIIESEDGELVAIDKNGTFYSTADSTEFIENKPEKAAVDRLVNDLRKAEETRMRKRRERGRNDDDGDVTFINDKNKQFNQKLARFYNKVLSAFPHLIFTRDSNSIPVHCGDTGQLRAGNDDMKQFMTIPTDWANCCGGLLFGNHKTERRIYIHQSQHPLPPRFGG